VRVLASICAAAGVLLLAACGSGGSAGGAADAVPADVAVYVELDTDFDGGQWTALEELAARFPGGEDLVPRFLEEIEAEGGGELSFEQDVDPALGPEFALVVLELPATPGGEPLFVGLTQPDDPAAFERLAAEGDEPAVTRQVGDWHVIADDEAAVDAYEDALGEGSLADSERFRSAMEDLDEEALARVYVSEESFAALLQADPALQGESLEGLDPAAAASAFGLVLRAEDDGARLDGRAVLSEEAQETGFSSEPYAPSLPDEVPADVLAFFSFGDLEGALSAYRDLLAESDPEVESQLGMAEGLLGVSLEGDVAPLFAEEGALYVRPGALVPELTLVTKVEDEEEAVATLDRLVEGAAAFGLPLAAPTRTDVDGVEARSLPVSPQVEVVYAAFDGLLVVTSSRDGIRDLRSDDERLADNDAFREALDRAGVPGETQGFGYVDLGDALPLLLGYAAAAGETPAGEVDAYLEPLESLVFYGDEDGDTASFTVFLGVD
jgi:hypothetical protein